MGACFGGSAEAKRDKKQLAEAMRALDELGLEKSKLEEELTRLNLGWTENQAGDLQLMEDVDKLQQKNNVLRDERNTMEDKLIESEENLEHARLQIERLQHAGDNVRVDEEEQVAATNKIATLEAELERVKQSNSENVTSLQRHVDRASCASSDQERLEAELRDAKSDLQYAKLELERVEIGSEERRSELDAKIRSLLSETERYRKEISSLTEALEQAEHRSAEDTNRFRRSLIETEDEVKRLERIVNDLEIALRETEDRHTDPAIDPRVFPIYDRLQRCLDQMSGREVAPPVANVQNVEREGKNQVEMLKQSHAALQLLKDALETERIRTIEVKESLEQEKVRSQLLLKVIRHFKKKLLLAPSYDPPRSPHDDYTPFPVAAY
eukprot:GEMP01015964.1.p1 GENE.GEMP01015964.1~~GEMP01015964.1.p1  ORF type:complete len:383 (+),score=93.84 GEMP01015964.1:112-1260(+)